MTTETPLHQRLKKELEAVIDEMVAANYERETVLAVMIDLLEGTNFDDMEKR